MIRVSATGSLQALPGCILHTLRGGEHAYMQAIGTAAVYQAVKALCIADAILSNEGQTMAWRSRFADIDIDGQTKTVIQFMVVRSKCG